MGVQVSQWNICLIHYIVNEKENKDVMHYAGFAHYNYKLK